MTSFAEIADPMPVIPYIRECGSTTVNRPWIFPERRLLDYLIVYVKEGECRFSCDDIPYDFGPGDFCLIQPGCQTTLEGLTDTVTMFAHFDVFYNSDRAQSFPTRPGQIDLSPYQHLMQPKMNDVFQTIIPVKLALKDAVQFSKTLFSMVDCWQNADPFSQLKAQHLATALVLNILEDHMVKPTVLSPSRLLQWVPSYFSHHLATPIRIRDMSLRANLSPSRFCALFRQTYGIAPHQYLLNMRVNHAKELMQTTDLPLESVASYCGFSSIHHFSKIFRQKTGMSPGAYRRGCFQD